MLGTEARQGRGCWSVRPQTTRGHSDNYPPPVLDPLTIVIVEHINNELLLFALSGRLVIIQAARSCFTAQLTVSCATVPTLFSLYKLPTKQQHTNYSITELLPKFSSDLLVP